MPSFHSIYFGCRANQADSAVIERDLSERGFVPAASSAQASVVILNSCTVTASADAELRQTVRRIHRQNPQARILVTGCYAQRRPQEIAALPGVEWVVGNSHKAAVGRLVEESSATKPAASAAFVPLTSLLQPSPPETDSDLRKLGSILVSGISSLRHYDASPYFGGAVEDRTRPNLKIQDGCNNRCSFCIIPSVRGLSRSLTAEEVIRQVRGLADSGYREVVLSGVNLGQYGRDLSGKPRFVQLLRKLLDETSIERLRLSSVEPMDFTDQLLDLMASTDRIARHIHAPLQSGSDRILRRMHRKYRVAQYRDRIRAAHARMPEAAFGADVIVGFPGETDSDFEATRALIAELPFTYLHVFSFSRRPGTPADTMKDQVNGAMVGERSRVLRELIAVKNLRFREVQVGRRLRVLTLGAGNATGSLALTENYLKVRIAGEPLAPNQWAQVEIFGVSDDAIVGRLSGSTPS